MWCLCCFIEAAQLIKNTESILFSTRQYWLGSRDLCGHGTWVLMSVVLKVESCKRHSPFPPVLWSSFPLG